MLLLLEILLNSPKKFLKRIFKKHKLEIFLSSPLLQKITMNTVVILILVTILFQEVANATFFIF